MPPKRSKSQTGSATGQKWEQAILVAQIQEAKWKPTISFVVGKQAEDTVNISVLAESIDSGIRKLYSVITREELYATVKDLGNTKAPKKTKEVPQYSEICEPCKTFLDNNEEIPLPLLAKLIKYRILHIKTTDQKRREAEKKSSADGPKSAAGKGGKADKKGGDRAKSAGKGKGGKKTPEPPSAKNDSKLRKRGEEDETGKYIDDEPDDGPEHYIIVTGFHQPHLIGQLSEIGVNVDAVIQMECDDYSRYQPKVSDDETEKDDKALALEEELNAQRDSERKALEKFWKDILLLLRSAAPTSSLHDVARLQYTVLDVIIPDDLEDAEKKVEFGKNVFEDVACMIYDMIDHKRQWQNYLKNLKLQRVPVFGDASTVSQLPDSNSLAPPPQTPSKKGQAAPDDSRTEGEKSVMAESEKPPQEVDMRYYNDLMNCVPHESASVPLILHSILEQVVASEEGLEPPSETPKPRRPDGLDDQLAKHVSSMVFKLALSQEEQSTLAENFHRPHAPNPVPKEPLLINHQDDVTMRLRHLKAVDGFDPVKAELEMMGFLPLASLNEFSQPQPKVFMERAARLQEMIHFVSSGALTQAEIDRAFKQFVFECMDWTKTEGDGWLQSNENQQKDVPWDDPYPFFRGMIPVVSDEMDISPDEEKMPSEAADLSQPDTSFFSDDDAFHLGADASNVSESSQRPRKKSKKKRKSEAVEVKTEDVDGFSESDNSRASTPGILKRSGSATSRDSRKSSSVHFDHGEEGELEAEGSDKTWVPGPNDPEWSDTNDKQHRNLDQWCFAEHMEPSVFLQVLQRCQHTHAVLDTYYHKRDHTLMVVLHNPSTAQHSNFSSWKTNLHSNLGFRNYLEHIAESITEWTEEEEAKYDAFLLAKEVENITKDAEEANSRPGSEKGDKKGGKGAAGKDKKGGKSPRSRSHSRSSSQERQLNENPFVRGNSLKAYKEEQEKMKAEEEEREREKELKRIKSADKKKAKEDEKKDDKKKRPSSRGSAKSKVSKEEVLEDEKIDGEKEPEQFWPFTGYDVGNKLIHVSGEVNTLLPSDGGVIRTETINYEQGTSMVKCSVMKDEHTFMVHVLDPKDPAEQPETPREKLSPSAQVLDSPTQPQENQQEETKPCIGTFGSFTAKMKDGMSLSLSVYGGSGAPVNGKKYEPETYEPPLPPTPAAATDGKGSPGKNKKDKGISATPEPQQPPEEEEVVAEVELPPPIVQTFNQLHVICPDGLQVDYMLQSALGIRPEDAEDRNIVVKQCYPFKTRGLQSCEASRGRAMQEVSRVISTDGTVVKTMQDGVIQVLYSDGTVSEFVQNSSLLPSGSRNASPQRPGSGKSPERDTPSPTKKASRGSRRSAKKKAEEEEVVETDPVPSGFWITTRPTGERICTKLDGSKVSVKHALISVASDPSTNQSMQTREDHVVCVKHPDGTVVVEHADGTRITSFWRQITVPGLDSEETGESSPTETKDVRVIVVECPGFATVKFDQTSMLQCSTEFGNGTVIHCSVDSSYDLYFGDGGYLQVGCDGTAIYFPRPNSELEVYNPNHQLQYCMRHFSEVIVETVDNEGNLFNVENSGRTVVVPVSEQEEEEAAPAQVQFYKQHAPCLFVVHPDGSGTQLLRYQDIAEYMANAEDDLSTAILMDSLPDSPGVMGITILKPYKKGLPEQWLKGYLQDTIVPPGLVSRDLTTLPAFEEVKDGPKFGTNVGQGLAVGSAIRGSAVPSILKCPNVLQIRQILQYKPITEELRNLLWDGLREYGEFVRSKLQGLEGLQLDDPRSAKEKAVARKLQELALQRQATMPVEAVQPGPDNLREQYETALAPPIPSPPPTPQPKRTKADWERDQREKAEEIENRRVLKAKEVPPYFQSELGKAFLLTQAPDLDTMRKELKEDPRSDASKAIRSNSTTPGDAGHTPSNLRPGNPTPGHAQGTGSPSSVRPKNPTPGHATKTVQPDRPGNPTPKEAAAATNGDYDSPNTHPSIPEMPEEGASECVSPSKKSPLLTTVTGEKRQQVVKLPSYIHSDRPLAEPNMRFSVVEDSVRRKVHNSSVAGATQQGANILTQMRGFELLPNQVNFGLLREGSTYVCVVNLKNTGVDACRFKLKQPPPSTGLKVLFHPGLVAAGMKAELKIQIYAIAAGVEGGQGMGSISHNLEIVTETDHLYLPIKAMIMTSYDYDKQAVSTRSLAPGVAYLTNKPPATQGIIRPHRHGEAV